MYGKISLKDAVYTWVEGFNAIPTAIISKLYSMNEDEVTEVTPLKVGGRVSVYDRGSGEIQSVDDDGSVTVLLDSNESTITVPLDDVERENEDVLPLWGTMWTFSSFADVRWLQNGGLDVMADLGFRVFEQEDFGFLFGLDAGGIDFYDAFWIPLYKARGLQWHTTD